MQVIEFFDRGVLINRDGVAFTTPDGQTRITYTEAFDLSHRIAAALRRDGCTDNTPVAVLSPNAPIVFPVILGVLRSGATWLAVNPVSGIDELADLLTLVGARVLLYAATTTDLATQLRARVTGLERTVCIDDPELSRWLPPAGTRVPLPPVDPDAVAALFGTGGTTGRPKAVEIPHRAFETMIHGLNIHLPETEPVNLVAAPMTHAAGALVFPVLSRGGTNVVHNGVRAAEILQSIEHNRITRIFLPPTAIYSLLDAPELAHTDTSTLRYFIYGAAPMSASRLRRAMTAFGPVLAQFYGQVEAPMILSFLSPAEHAEAVTDRALAHRLLSCGRPSTVATIAIVDEAGEPVDRGTTGEIVVRSTLVMRGYHANPEQTAATRRPGGWHATGDLGYLDDDGYLYLVDRKRDLIISGGFNVYPSEVEHVLWNHPAVRDCAVIGIPDPKWGERVAAVVELRPDVEVTSDELIQLCKQRLGSVKAPKEIIFRALPRSPVGKVLKRELRDSYWAGHGRNI
ncbi:AMP-binding protein [Nocardia cyriacigeorgica]|uniref:AMP-binding protein n=1 Tax=Nocardia cyriacigeorgica TaxID=135487 RepID=UPI002453AE1F|nr:AMP-binding protein [Nocardia cyriacigeorgica]